MRDVSNLASAAVKFSTLNSSILQVVFSFWKKKSDLSHESSQYMLLISKQFFLSVNFSESIAC